MSIGLPEKEHSRKEAPSLDEAGILVVDDDPAFQLGLKTFLREYAGFEQVFTANDGREALELIEEEPSICVITLDNEMPGLTGVEVLEQLAKEDVRPLSVVMITGNGTSDLENTFKKFDSPSLIAKHYMAKPVTFEELEPVIIHAYEELKMRPIADEPDIEQLINEDTTDSDEATSPVSPAENISDQLEEIKAKLEENTETINDLRLRIPTIEKRFWLEIVKILTIAALAWLVIQLDALSHAKRWVNQIKSLATPTEKVLEEKPSAQKPETPAPKEPESKSPPAASPENTEPAADSKPAPKPKREKKKLPPVSLAKEAPKNLDKETQKSSEPSQPNKSTAKSSPGEEKAPAKL